MKSVKLLKFDRFFVFNSDFIFSTMQRLEV